MAHNLQEARLALGASEREVLGKLQLCPSLDRDRPQGVVQSISLKVIRLATISTPT